MKKVKNYAPVILALLCIGLWIPNFAQYQVAGFGVQVQESMHLSPSQFSSIATAPLIPGIFLSLFSGLLVDRFGARKILTLGAIISTIAIVLRVFTTGFWTMYLTMIFIGINATFLNSNGGKILGQWFSPEKMSVGMGFFLAFANAGIALGTGTVSLFSGMKSGFTFSAAASVIITVLWIFFMRDKAEEAPEKTEDNGKGKKESVWHSVVVAAKCKTVWLCACCLFLSIGAITTMSNFMPSALMERGLPESQATIVTMALMLGGLCGCFVGPAVSKLFKTRWTFFAVSGIIAVLGAFVFWRISKNPVVLFILLFIAGLACNGVSPIIMSMPVQDEHIGTRYGGTAGGFVATVQLGCSVIIPSYVLTPIATRADGTANYPLLFSLFGILMCGFIVVSRFLPDKKKDA